MYTYTHYTWRLPLCEVMELMLMRCCYYRTLSPPSVWARLQIADPLYSCTLYIIIICLADHLLPLYNHLNIING